MAKDNVITDPKHPVDYSKKEVPPTYKCQMCSASGVKLWREAQTFLENQTLLCARCAAEVQGRRLGSISDEGLVISVVGQIALETDQIGWFLPAVPTRENDTFWGYTSVPEDGVNWWKALPSLPKITEK